MTVQLENLQETARRLGVSAKTLEQYFALKAAEVTPKEPQRRPIGGKASAAKAERPGG